MTAPRDRDGVIARRLAVQRLTSPPLDDPVDVVRLLLCVQAQDARLSRFSLGLRSRGATDASICAALDSGRIVRTHILRPTWHYVAADDLHWLLALTSPKVESSMAARTRRLGFGGDVIDRALDVTRAALHGRRFLDRREIGAAFADAGLPVRGEEVGHALLIAELRGVVCSGPMRAPTGAHTYGLVDELIGPAPAFDRASAVRELVRRFFAGHGPASIADLQRWTKVTIAEVRAALDELGPELAATTIDEHELWSGAHEPPAVADDAPGAFLLPMFDEAYLTYRMLNFPRSAANPLGDGPHDFGEGGDGVVVCDRHDVGEWHRRMRTRGAASLRIHIDRTLDRGQIAAIDEAIARFERFTGSAHALVRDRPPTT